MTEEKTINMLSIDVEDYFQVAALSQSIRREDWDQLEHRVVANMDKVLQLFSERGIKATFFMLSWLAERYPGIVNDIVEQVAVP